MFIGLTFRSFQFWMYCREDLRKLKRITLLWDYIREVTELNAPLLRGETRELKFAGSPIGVNP